VATTALGYDNFFSTTLSAGITASDTTISLNALPTASEGYLVIEPDSSTAREIIYYTSKTGSAVVCPSAAAGRGVGGTTAASHAINSTVEMNTVAEMWEALQDGTGMAAGSIKPSNLAAGTGSTWAWQSWTPTFSNVSGGSLSYAKYNQDGKDVKWRLKYVMNGANIGGAITWTLPIAASSDYAADDILDARGAFLDAANNLYDAKITYAASSQAHMRPVNAAGTNAVFGAEASTTNPFTFGNADQFTAGGGYEAN